MSIFKGSVFYSVGKDGWGETYFIEAADQFTAFSVLDALNTARCALLPTPAQVDYARVSVPGQPPDADVSMTTTQTGQYALVAPVTMLTPTDVPDASAFVLTQEPSDLVPPVLAIPETGDPTTLTEGPKAPVHPGVMGTTYVTNGENYPDVWDCLLIRQQTDAYRRGMRLLPYFPAAAFKASKAYNIHWKGNTDLQAFFTLIKTTTKMRTTTGGGSPSYATIAKVIARTKRKRTPGRPFGLFTGHRPIR